MTALPEDVDVLVVGYGPVGAALAGLLGRYGVRTLVVDRATDVFMAPRAIALDNEALRILQMVGLPEDAFAKVAIPYVRMHCPHVGEFGRVNTAGTIDGHPKLVTFYQPELERALRANAELQPTVTARTAVDMVRFEDDGDRGERRASDERGRGVGRAGPLPGRRRRGQLEGPERHRRGIRGRDLRRGLAHRRRPRRPWDLRPRRVPVRPRPPHAAHDRARRPHALGVHAQARRDARGDGVGRDGSPSCWGHGSRPEELRIERKAVYRFHARVCRSFGKGRVFLAGDAAHLTPPFAGQGLVAGLRDAANLAWKLAWVARGQASPTILDTYDQERRPHAMKMIRLAKLMGQIVMPRSHLRAILVHGSMALLRRLPAVRGFFDELGIKPQNAFDEGLFVPGRRPRPARRVASPGHRPFSGGLRPAERRSPRPRARAHRARGRSGLLAVRAEPVEVDARRGTNGARLASRPTTFGSGRGEPRGPRWPPGTGRGAARLVHRRQAGSHGPARRSRPGRRPPRGGVVEASR